MLFLGHYPRLKAGAGSMRSRIMMGVLETSWVCGWTAGGAPWPCCWYWLGWWWFWNWWRPGAVIKCGSVIIVRGLVGTWGGGLVWFGWCCCWFCCCGGLCWAIGDKLVIMLEAFLRKFSLLPRCITAGGWNEVSGDEFMLCIIVAVVRICCCI